VTDDKPRKVRKLSARALCDRYGVVTRTIDRWVQANILPQPTIINKRRYWDEAGIELADRQREGQAAA
jgi:hypothetical protein